MYVCICRGITEKQLQNASRGKTRVRDVLRRLNVGEDCGACLSLAVETYFKHKGVPQRSHRQEAMSSIVRPLKQR